MKILLHVCCGVCASSVIERLLCEGHTVTAFFYNPNIHPADEYKRRLEAVKKAVEGWGVEVVEGMYDREEWFRAVKGKEYEPEGSKRCDVCFRTRLQRTYEYMKKHNYDAFTTTLTVSPKKEMSIVNSIGSEIGGERFIRENFKKKGGFQRAMELSKEMELYRQHYCGCIYSLEEGLRKEKAKREDEKEQEGYSFFKKS